MNKFNSERVAKMKTEFYHVIGKLEVIKNIIISDEELKEFEKCVSECVSEVDVATLILGATRRYKLLLDVDHVDEQRIASPTSGEIQFDDLSFCVAATTREVTIFPFVEANLGNSEDSFVLNDVDQLVNEEESHILDDSDLQLDQSKILTNSLSMRKVEDIALTTTRENKAFFITYSESEGNSALGCVFTLKRQCKDFMKYECKMCRRFEAQEKKVNKENYPSHQLPSSIQVVNGSFNFIKSTHHDSCYVESLATAFTRSEKNLCVQHKGQFSVTAKQAYDIFTKRIERSSTKLNITPRDIAKGFKTFDSAKPALKKANKRKSSVQNPKMMNAEGKVDKLSTEVLKTDTSNEPDYFLIHEAEESGTIILGSRFLIKKFFESAKVGSDGTFKMSPIGYSQVYMLWTLHEGFVEGEFAPRSKALPAIYMILKGKTQALYEEAFGVIEKYRQENKLPYPAWTSYLLDDEIAVQNVVEELYSFEDIIELCFFHVNKNILKCLMKFKLSSFVKNCESDGELWFYGKFKQILVLPLLPLCDIHDAFTSLKQKIISFFEYHFENQYQRDQLAKFFDKIEENYYGHTDKMKKICKNRKTMRGTNLIEASHGSFNKSIFTPKHATVSNLIYGLKCIDLQYQTLAADYDMKGVQAFPKKKNREQEREQKLHQYYQQLDDKLITNEQFLELAAELWIQKKYYVMIKEATKAFENITEPSDSLDDETIDDFMDAVFINDEPSKRVRKLCSKYYGDEWDNN